MRYMFRRQPDESYHPSHLALQLPEIVSHILYYLDTYSTVLPKRIPDNTLLECLLVNHLWHDCAARIVWRSISFDDTDFDSLVKLGSVLSNLPPTISSMTSAASALAVAAPFCYSTSATICTDDEPMALETYGQPQQLPPPQPQPNKTAALRLFRPFTASRSIMPSLSGTTTRSASGDKLFSAKSSLPNPWSFSFYEEDRNEDPLSRGQSRATMATSMYTVATRAQRNTHHLDLYRSAVRSLTLRKIKEKAVNEPLVQIGRYATKVNKLDLYICDYLSNEVLFGFAAHGTLTYLSLAGCNRITDEAILYVAHHCRNLEHLDLRACGLISDKSISAIAMHCPQLRHLNVGRVRDRERITIKSIGLIAQHTQVAVLGLAGCDITDECLITLAMYRNNGLERISVNSCYRITNKSIRAYVEYCPRLSVFEMKECHQINDWNAVADLVQRKVLLTLCDQQNRACAEWAKRMGRVIHVKAPLK